MWCWCREMPHTVTTTLRVRNGNSRWCDVKKTARMNHSENVLLSFVLFSTLRCIRIRYARSLTLAPFCARSLSRTRRPTHAHIHPHFIRWWECLSVFVAWQCRESLHSVRKLSIVHCMCVCVSTNAESIAGDVYDIRMRDECFASFAERYTHSAEWDKHSNDFSGLTMPDRTAFSRIEKTVLRLSHGKCSKFTPCIRLSCLATRAWIHRTSPMVHTNTRTRNLARAMHTLIQSRKARVHIARGRWTSYVQ